MPEIWLNYGSTEVALDIKAENLEEKIDVEGKTLSDSEIKSKLKSLDISKPTEFVVLNMSESIKKILSSIFEMYEQKSIPKPTILADRKIMNVIKIIFRNTALYLNFLTLKIPTQNWFLLVKWNLMGCLVMKPYLQDY